MAHSEHRDDGGPHPLRGVVAGLAGGIAAAAAMSAFQAWAAKILPSDKSESDDPATVKAADRLTRAVTGHGLGSGSKDAAGAAVHYVTGAVLGMGYGLLAEFRPSITDGGGTFFGSAVEALLDDAAAPALGLASPPQQAPASTHLYGISSHLVFGGMAEAVRQLVVGVWPKR